MVGIAYNLLKLTLASALNNQVGTPKEYWYLLTKLLMNSLEYNKFHFSNISFCSRTTKMVLTIV